MASTRTDYLALKKQPDSQTPVKPTNFIAFKDGELKFEQEIIENNSKKGTRYGILKGTNWKITTNGEYTVDLDTNESGYFLLMALWKYNKEVLEAWKVFKHTYEMANSLPAFSIEQLKGNPEGDDHEVSRGFWVFADNLSIEASDSVVEMKVGLKALGIFLKWKLLENATSGVDTNLILNTAEGLVATDNIKITDKANWVTEETITKTVVTSEKITADINNWYLATDNVKVELLPQTPGSTGNCGINEYTFIDASFQIADNLTDAENATEENIENWSFEYQNNLEERYGSLRASPSTIGAKGVKAYLKYTKYFENLEDRDRYLDGIDKAVIITLRKKEKINWTNFNFEIKIKLPKVKFKAHNLNGGTDDLYITELESMVNYDCNEGKAIIIEQISEVADYEA